MTDNLPVPFALIKLSICNCKGVCSTRRHVLKLHLYVLICASALHAITVIHSKAMTRKYLNMMNQTLKITHNIQYLASLFYIPSQN